MRRGTTRRTVAAVGIAGLLQSLAVPLASFISLPLVLSQVGLQAYGWWSGLAGFVALLALADGGLRIYVNRAVAQRNGGGADDSADTAAADSATDTGATDTGAAHTRAADGVESIEELVRRSLGLVAAIGAALVVLVWAARVPLQGFLAPEAVGGDATHLQWLLVALTALLGVSLCNGVLYAYIGGLQRADLATGTVVVATLLAVTVNVVAAFAGAGIDSFLYGSIAGALVSTTSALWWSRRLFGSRRIWRPARPAWATDKVLLGGSTVLLLAGALRVGDVQLAKVVASHLLGADDTAALAVVATLTGIGVAAALAPSAPLLTAIAEVGLAGRGERVLRTAADLTAAAAAAAAAGLFVLGPALLRVWLRTDVAGADATVRWLAPAIIPTVAAIVLSSALIALGRERVVAVAASTALLALAAAAVVGARVAGLAGIAVALALVYLGVAVCLRAVGGAPLRVVTARALRHALVAVPIAAVGALVVDALPTPGVALWLVEAAVLGAVLAAAHAWALDPANRLEALSGVRALRGDSATRSD